MTAEALAARPGVRSLDPSACDARIAEVATLVPYLANAVTVRADGSVVCTARPPPTLLDSTRFQTFQHVAQTGQPAIGRLARSVNSGKWVVPMATAIRDASGAVAGGVVLTVDVQRLAPLGVQLEADGGFVALVDRSGRVLMRVPEEGRIGADASASVSVRTALERGDGHSRARGRKGDDQIFGFARVEGADWVAIAAVPARSALAASRESAARSSIFGALLLLVAGAAAYLAGRGIERPMRAIARTARRVAEGDSSARAPVAGSHETAEVATQLNRLLDRLPAIESRLRESEQRLHVVIGAAREGILVVDADERIRFANDAAARLLGMAQASEMIGNAAREILPEGLVDERERHLAQRREGPGDRYEVRIRAHDGAERWLHVSATALRGDAGAGEGVLAMLYDVTEGKEIEERLGRLTRLYWALSKVNQAIVRTSDRAALFATTCRIVVDDGGFASAFVSLLDREVGQLVPVAAAGSTLGEMGRDPVSLDVTAPGAAGILAKAVITGEPQIVNDFQAEPGTLPAREPAAATGIRSFAALPLRCEDRVIGALAVHASERDCFDIGLGELLRQIADDVSYALGLYERAAARDRTEAGIRARNA
jgi:PAS domain S-box-containing protein